MSWSGRVLLGLVLLPLIAGCGFHPMYSEEEAEAVDPALASITVLPIPNRIGQELEFMLREQLNPDHLAVKRLYDLRVTLTAVREDLGIQRDASSVRGRVDLSATLVLSRADDHTVVYRAAAQTNSDFNILADAYAANVAEENARDLSVRDMSREIRTRLAIFLRRHLPRTS